MQRNMKWMKNKLYQHKNMVLRIFCRKRRKNRGFGVLILHNSKWREWTFFKEMYIFLGMRKKGKITNRGA